jgi:hypothetical protein
MQDRGWADEEGDEVSQACRIDVVKEVDQWSAKAWLARAKEKQKSRGCFASGSK